MYRVQYYPHFQASTGSLEIRILYTKIAKHVGKCNQQKADGIGSVQCSALHGIK